MLLKYIVLLIVTIVCSLGGVWWGVHTGNAVSAQRGGGIATALSFFTLFLRPDNGLELYRVLTEREKARPPEFLPLEWKVECILRALETNSEGLTKQNMVLAAAGIIGAIFWGFGDVFAGWFM